MPREAAKIRTLDGLAMVESFLGSEHVSGKPRVYLTVRAMGREAAMFLTPIAARRLAAKLLEHADACDRSGSDGE